MYAVPSAPAALEINTGDMLQKDIEGAITTLEHLAARAAYAQEPCAQILFRTAELLRIAVIKR
jgi:hypothetical protein